MCAATRIDETTQDADFAFWDRTTERPMLAIRRLTFTFARGPISIEAGKQFMRWGQTDILAPTDRFAPRDYLTVPSNELLAVTAARSHRCRQGAFARGGLHAAADAEPHADPHASLDRSGGRNRRLRIRADAARRRRQVSEPIAVRPALEPRGPLVRALDRVLPGFNSLPLLPVALNPRTGTIDVRREYPAIQVWGGDIVGAADCVRAEG